MNGIFSWKSVPHKILSACRRDIYCISFCIYSEGVAFGLCILLVVLCFVFVAIIFVGGLLPFAFTLRG